jgi:hypothetical protein
MQRSAGRTTCRSIHDRQHRLSRIAFRIDLSVEQRQRFSPPRIVVRARLAGEPAIHAEAVATTSFARPVERADRLEERPSLYAPFWRAQRVAARSDERLLAATLDATPTWIALVPR